MMLSHNTIDGIQMHANHEIMTEHFRDALGYEGFFASDLGKPTVSLSDPPHTASEFRSHDHQFVEFLNVV